MKKMILAIAAIASSIPALAQADKPGAVAARGVDAVVVVRSVDQQARTVILEGPRGNQFEMQVPPEAQNLDQVHEGSKFNVRYLESMAVFISPVGGEPAADEVSAMELAEKGATPAGIIVNVKQVQARVDAIDVDARTVVLTGPLGKAVELSVDERVQRLSEIKAGDIIVVRYTEALAMKMIKE
jgi:hypothetical protein